MASTGLHCRLVSPGLGRLSEFNSLKLCAVNGANSKQRLPVPPPPTHTHFAQTLEQTVCSSPSNKKKVAPYKTRKLLGSQKLKCLPLVKGQTSKSKVQEKVHIQPSIHPFIQHYTFLHRTLIISFRSPIQPEHTDIKK